MHSLKNTAVAVILLGISFGLYQVSLTPLTDAPTDGQKPGEQIFDDLTSQNSSFGHSKSLGNQADALPKNSAAPFPAAPQLNVPELGKTNHPISAPLGSPSKTAEPQRQPLVTTTENGVQSIQYPNLDDTANRFDASPQSTASPFPIGEAPQFSQRELVDPALDAGLIDALKIQSELEATRNSTNQFTAQPIGTAKPEFDSDATELVGTMTPSANFKTDLDSQGNRGFGDAGVSLATPLDSNSPPKLLDSQSSAYDQLTIRTVWPQVDQLVAEADFYTALKLLSRFYRDETLSGPQRQRLVGWLDALAGKVIFSDENHLAAEPYQVGSNESLTDIAAKWKVPAQLVYNVNANALPNPLTVAAGTQLKPIPGPFTAEIDLQSKVMTMFLGDLYAVRFPIRVGISGEPRPGKFEVLVKSESGHAWRDSNGVDYPPGSPENGYGPYWIGLSGSLCIHAISDTAGDEHYGCIGLTANDAKDVFAILAEGAELTIRR
jgi:hypothetical protein